MWCKVIFSWVALFILFLILIYPLSDILPRNNNSATPDISTEQTTVEAFGKLPVLFIQNQGQLDEAVEYYVKAPAQTLYFTKDSIIFDLSRNNRAEATGTADRQAERLVFSLDFLNANSQPTIEGTGKDGAVVNYFMGNDPEKWRIDVPTYREVVYHDIYPSIDLRLRGKGNMLEYDFVVKPGAAPEDIRLAYNGIDSLTIEDGELIVGTGFGNIKQYRPYIYQQIADQAVDVAGGFRPLSGNTYGFYVAAYDNRYPLVIDPTLAYSTYLGGSGQDVGEGIAVDAAGCAYVTGYTESTNFPTKNPYPGANGSTEDVFVAKLSAAGNALVYSTYLGGGGADEGYGIAVDAAGCAYVTGYTDSSDFPTKNPYRGYAGNADAFVTKLTAAGNALVYSTYLGGGGADAGYGISVDSAGCAFVTGSTCSSNFPTQNPYQGTYAGRCNAFVAKLTAAGDSLIYSTYLGNVSTTAAYGIAVDSAGCAYVTGDTYNGSFPTQNAYQGTNGGDRDAFVTKLSATGNALVYSTYLGGSKWDRGNGIAVDTAGCAYITGETDSSNFPAQNQYQAQQAGDRDAFVAKLSAAGNALVYSTCLGGSSFDSGDGIAVDSTGCAYVTGQTISSDFPSRNPYQQAKAKSYDVFVTKLAAAGNALVYSTYLGGSNEEGGKGIAVDSIGCAYVTGWTWSSDFPTQSSYQWTYGGGGVFDAFVAKLVTSMASVSTATGTGTATFITSDGTISGLTAMATTTCGMFPVGGVSFPHGFFSFNITGIPAGSTVTVAITFPSAIPANAQYWKCTPSSWVQIPIVSISGNVMTIQLTDGGIGDTDGAANGTIVDPGGPVVLAQPSMLLAPWMITLISVAVVLVVTATVLVVRFRWPAWLVNFRRPK